MGGGVLHPRSGRGAGGGTLRYHPPSRSGARSGWAGVPLVPFPRTGCVYLCVNLLYFLQDEQYSLLLCSEKVSGGYLTLH